MKLTEISTPALILHRPKMLKNISQMQNRLADHKAPMRPHLKTSKSAEIAKLLVQGQPGGATVSTLSEAKYFFQYGFTDLIYAVPIAPGKLDQVATLMREGLDLKILLDSVETAQAVAKKGENLGITFKAILEIDTDGHRTGLKPTSDKLITAGEILHKSEGSSLMGVLTHAGSSYNCNTTQAIMAVAEQERAGAVRAAERLREHQLPCPVVSIGSTPTANFGSTFEGVTEVRAGVFVFQDLYQAALGVCALDDMAVAVLAEIIGTDPETNRVFIDAGALALSKDRSTGAATEDMGYGLASRPDAPVAEADLIVDQVFQEHGVLRTRTPNTDVSKYTIGDRLLIWPNHACMTAAAHGVYHVTDDGQTVAALWERNNGWRSADTQALDIPVAE